MSGVLLGWWVAGLVAVADHVGGFIAAAAVGNEPVTVATVVAEPVTVAPVVDKLGSVTVVAEPVAAMTTVVTKPVTKDAKLAALSLVVSVSAVNVTACDKAVAAVSVVAADGRAAATDAEIELAHVKRELYELYDIVVKDVTARRDPKFDDAKLRPNVQGTDNGYIISHNLFIKSVEELYKIMESVNELMNCGEAGLDDIETQICTLTDTHNKLNDAYAFYCRRCKKLWPSA